MCSAPYQHSIHDNLLLCWLLIYFHPDLKEFRSQGWRLKFTQGTSKRTQRHSAKFKLEVVVNAERKDQKSSPHGEGGWDLSCDTWARFPKPVKAGTHWERPQWNSMVGDGGHTVNCHPTHPPSAPVSLYQERWCLILMKSPLLTPHDWRIAGPHFMLCGWMDRWIDHDEWMERSIEWMDRWIGEGMNGWVGEWVDGWEGAKRSGTWVVAA